MEHGSDMFWVIKKLRGYSIRNFANKKKEMYYLKNSFSESVDK